MLPIVANYNLNDTKNTIYFKYELNKLKQLSGIGTCTYNASTINFESFDIYVLFVELLNTTHCGYKTQIFKLPS